MRLHAVGCSGEERRLGRNALRTCFYRREHDKLHVGAVIKLKIEDTGGSVCRSS